MHKHLRDLYIPNSEIVVISGKGGSESFNYSVSLKNILNHNTLVIPLPHTQLF